MGFSDGFFKKVEQKTNINKDTIMGLANKLSQGDLKDERMIGEVISDISSLTGKEVSEEKRQKIIDTIVNDKVPKNMDNLIK